MAVSTTSVLRARLWGTAPAWSWDVPDRVVSGAIVSIVRACVRARDLNDDSFADSADRACLMLERGLAGSPS
jgi:hypothetical protein